MVHHHKLNTLSGICVLAQSIDAHYWEHQAEISHENPTSRSSVHKSKHKSDSSKSKSKSGNGSSHSKQKKKNSSTILSKGSTSEKKENPLNLSSKLGKDGKLTTSGMSMLS